MGPHVARMKLTPSAILLRNKSMQSSLHKLPPLISPTGETYIYVYIYLCIYIYIYTYICTCIYVYTLI
jgi:hypothetical protein